MFSGRAIKGQAMTEITGVKIKAAGMTCAAFDLSDQNIPESPGEAGEYQLSSRDCIFSSTTKFVSKG